MFLKLIFDGKEALKKAILTSFIRKLFIAGANDRMGYELISVLYF